MKTKYLPMFPLGMVVYPQERVNLHIFEPRYRQLVNDCLTQGTTFGIPTFVNDQVQKYGTEMRVAHLHQRYDDGRLDIETEGLSVFRILEFENPAPGKLHAGASVEILTVWGDPQSDLVEALMTKVKELHRVLQTELKLRVPDYDYLSHAWAHKIGLSTEQEYEMLTLLSEKERQKYLLDHLEKAIPIISEMERTKERIRMNGHFRQFDPLDF